MKYLVPQNLETERLNLRMFTEADWPDMHEFYSDAEAVKYTIGKPMTETESWRKVAALIGHWEMRRYGCYALEEKQTGKVIGLAGLEYPAGWPDPEIQWSLARHSWKKGYAAEAVMAIKKMVPEFVPDISFISIIHPDNADSGKLANKVGAHFEKEFFFRDTVWHIYRHKPF
jgi:RimJ/RimL family protein N-acetyltransferase